MRRKHIALSLFGLLAVGACSGRDATVQRELTPTSPLFAKPGSGGSCDFALITNDAKTFFATGNDPVFALITSMQTFYAAANYTDATNSGWDIQARIAAARLTSAQQGTPSDGFKLSTDVFSCMGSSPTATIQVPLDFKNYGALALQEGVFEVRGGATDATGPAAAYLKNGTRVFTTPRWGVEGTWPTANGRFLVYGYPSTVTAFLTGAPTINQNSTTPPAIAYNAINMGTVPAGAEKGASPLLTVGICGVPAPGTGQAVTLAHFSTSASVLAAVTPSTLCTFTATFTLSPLQIVTKTLASLFTVQPAYALGDGFNIGGLPSDWSPFTSGQSSTGNFALTFSTQPPAVGFTSKPTIFEVTATTKDEGGNFVPAEGVTVTVTIAGNNGLPATFDGSPSVSGVTGPDGIAHFSTKITKAGGYTISASGSLAAGASATTTSMFFNIKNK
jgi:hypothetical protein